MNTCAVSIIIPTYNSRDLLVWAIDSVLGQTCKEFELIIVNDGSTDDTDKAVGRYLPGGCRHDPRVKYLKMPCNKGKNAALNKGIGESRGEFIMFLDQDDTLPPESVAIGAEALQRHPTAAAVYGDATKIDISGKPMGIRKSRQIRRRSEIAGSFRNPIASSSVIMRRSAVEAISPLNEYFFRIDDVCRNLRLHLHGDLEYVPAVLMNYRIYKRPGILKYRIRTITEFRVLIGEYFSGYERYSIFLKQITFQLLKLAFEMFSFHK
jgi:glycosyltransferase involved in cell wall biosynthesis